MLGWVFSAKEQYAMDLLFSPVVDIMGQTACQKKHKQKYDLIKHFYLSMEPMVEKRFHGIKE